MESSKCGLGSLDSFSYQGFVIKNHYQAFMLQIWPTSKFLYAVKDVTQYLFLEHHITAGRVMSCIFFP